MAKIDSHPDVIEVRRRAAEGTLTRPPTVLDADQLRTLCLEAGAEDVGFVEIERLELADERVQIEKAFKHPKALISICCRVNQGSNGPATGCGHGTSTGSSSASP